MAIQEAEQWLQFRIDKLQDTRWYDMAKLSIKGLDMNEMKAEVYLRILEYINMEGYPTEASAG